MPRSVLHVRPPASSAEPQEFLPADHSIAGFATTGPDAAKQANTIFLSICVCSV